MNFNPHIKNDSIKIAERLRDHNSYFDKSTILITGAFGFLGQQFLYYFSTLIEDLGFDIKIIAYDNFITGNKSLYQIFSKKSYLELLEIDIIKQKIFPNADFIIHAASIASPIFYRKFPIETLDANVNGYRNLLEFYKKDKIKSLLYFSTSEIYGDPPADQIPTNEEFRGLVSTTGPRACYDESKRLGETLSVLFYQVHEVPVKIVRPFNNYGPGLKISDRRVLPDFFKDILNNQNIKLFSNGKATRTFCYTEDAMVGYLLLLLSNYNAEPFNIGTENPEISIYDLAKKCIEVSEKKEIEIIFDKSSDLNYLSDNPNRRCPDITKAKKLLGYNPMISLEEGLLRSFQYYKETFNK